MIHQFLYLVLVAKGLVAFLLMVKIGPLRGLVINCLDQLKKIKGTIHIVAAFLSVFLFSRIIGIVKIQRKGDKIGTMTAMDQVLFTTYSLEATLMVFILFLGFLIARMHLHFRELIRLRSRVRTSRQETERLEKEKLQLKEKEEKANKEKTRLQKEISNITENLKKLKVESEEKEKRFETAKAHVAALQKQSADLLLEYDRLLEDNQNLQTQALRMS